jgi:O-antigen biosynthesis protein
MRRQHSVTALIPNYNGRALFEKYLPSVIATLQAGDELMIVDDTSTDDSVAWLIKTYGAKRDSSRSNNDFTVYSGSVLSKQGAVELTCVVNASNLRFGASCNRGVEQAKHDLIFLLNSDVAPHSDALEHLYHHFLPDPITSNVFGVGCLEIETAQNGAHAGKQILWFEKGLFMHSKAPDFSAGETAWVTGGSGLFSREKWLEIGGFDALFYPAYWEDIDLSFQARKKGWQILFEPKAVVDHNHETTNQTVFGQRKIAEMSWRNGLKFAWKNASFFQRLAFMFWQPYWWWQRAKQRHV